LKNIFHIIALLLSAAAHAQVHKLKAGAYVDKIVLGKTMMREVDSVNFQKMLKPGNYGGGVSYVQNSGRGISFSISCKDLAGGIAVVYPYLTDSSEAEAAARARYAHTLVGTILVHAPAIAVDPKGLQLTGKTAQQIRAAYPKSVFEVYMDYIDNTVLIDYASGVAFVFDAKTRKCISVEVFNGRFCFSKEYAEVLRNSLR
jgi:hypothetical protein